jgi:hypothetical protein
MKRGMRVIRKVSEMMFTAMKRGADRASCCVGACTLSVL